MTFALVVLGLAPLPTLLLLRRRGDLLAHVDARLHARSAAASVRLDVLLDAHARIRPAALFDVDALFDADARIGTTDLANLRANLGARDHDATRLRT